MDLLPHLLEFRDPEVRAAAVFALGAMIQAQNPAFAGPSLSSGTGAHRMGSADRLQAERRIAEHLLSAVEDASPLVRSEVAVAFGRVACGHADMFQVCMLSHGLFNGRKEGLPVCAQRRVSCLVPLHRSLCQRTADMDFHFCCSLRSALTSAVLTVQIACIGCGAFQPASNKGRGRQQHAGRAPATQCTRNRAGQL